MPRTPESKYIALLERDNEAMLGALELALQWLEDPRSRETRRSLGWIDGGTIKRKLQVYLGSIYLNSMHD